MIKIEESWKRVLNGEFKKPYWKNLVSFIKSEILSGKQIFPYPEDIFAGFEICPFDKVKVVIIGQDPYHSISSIDGKNIPTAHGLCFSVVKGAKVPPSLKNIYKELKTEFRENFIIPEHGNLEKWAEQGILLLNTTLTVEEHKPLSHKGKGWEEFTDKVIEMISREKTGVIFLLWGRHAQSKKSLIDLDKHFVLQATHPSPFSAHNGFLGCNCFKDVNKILVKEGEQVIDWQI
jgi:uracil-DNA glycosylase